MLLISIFWKRFLLFCDHADLGFDNIMNSGCMRPGVTVVALSSLTSTEEFVIYLDASGKHSAATPTDVP